MAITGTQLFWCVMALWSLVGGLAWMFHSGRQLLLRAKNPFQLFYRALWFGPLVSLVALIFAIDRALGKIHLWEESKEEQEADEEKAKNLKEIE